MTFEVPLKTGGSKINEVVIGTEGVKVKVGGQNCLPFHNFDGEVINKPIVAFEIYDVKPEGWASWLMKYYEDVYHDPILWAKKCISEYNADAINLNLISADPGGLDAEPEKVAEIVKKMREEISVPLIVYGCGNLEKDSVLLRKVFELNAETNLLAGAAEEDNYKPIAAAALGFKDNVITLSPVDINLAKQLNILVTQLGVKPECVVMDPVCSAIGYGIEYAYSINERLKIAAIYQGDKSVANPIINTAGREVWKIKENKLSKEEASEWGDEELRGIIWEASTAMTLFIGGSDIVTMRHPKAVKIVRELIDELLVEEVK